MEIKKDLGMFEGITADGIFYFLGFLSALISVAKSNNKETLDINQIEIAIESAKRQSKAYTDKLIEN